MIFKIIISVLMGYLLGSINTSLLIGKVFYKKDVREHGSGNAGATNTLRTLGKAAALAVVAGDILKGVLAYLAGFYLAGELEPQVYAGAYAAALFAVVGHNWPVFFGFKGGKGVMTSFAVVMMFSPVEALLCLALFIVVVAITRYVSLGSMLCAVLFPVLLIAFSKPLPMILVSIVLALLILFRHHANIKRLLAGNEKKISFKSSSNA